MRERRLRNEPLEAVALSLLEAAGEFMLRVVTLGEADVAIWSFGSGAIRGFGMDCRCSGAATGTAWRLLAANSS